MPKRVHRIHVQRTADRRIWTEISQKFDLEFIQLPDELLARLAKEGEQERGIIPAGLYRGIERPIPTVVRTGTVVYGRADMPDEQQQTLPVEAHELLVQRPHGVERVGGSAAPGGCPLLQRKGLHETKNRRCPKTSPGS